MGAFLMGAGGLQFVRDYAIIFNVSLSPCATVHRQCKNRAGVKNLEKHVSAVLVAAGSSTRMGFDKLSFDLGGETVLGRSIRAFEESPLVSEIVLVAGKNREYVEAQAAACTKPVQVVQGGATRAESAKNGVLAAHGELVAVHDAARPFVSEAVIEAVVEAAAKCGAAAPAVPVKDTIKQATRGDGKKVPAKCVVETTPDRSTLYAVQTPQCFDRAAYLAALEELDEEKARLVTDDCSLFELTGRTVQLTQGDYANLKITTREDLPRTEQKEGTTWIYRGLMFLVVSCPCALVVSIPLGFFAGIGCASKNGILVKGSNFIEKLAKLDTVVFDKTGTLTKGVFAVKGVYSVIDKNELIKYAAYAEFYSTHPIAVSVKNAYKNTVDTAKILNYTEISGMGISADIDGHKVLAGNGRLLESNNISHEKAKSHIGSIIYIAVDGKFAGYIVISDEIKADSKAAISALKQLNIKSVMLTGDIKKNADYTAEQIGIDKVYSQLLPQDKVSKLEEILSSKNHKKNVAFVGDGINDAPVLMRSDVGIAMGGIGSDSAIEAADVVLMTDEPSKIAKASKISAKTMSVIIQNIVFAIGVKVLVMNLSVLGISTMWLAIFADVGVSLLAILNSLRALYYKD